MIYTIVLQCILPFDRKLMYSVLPFVLCLIERCMGIAAFVLQVN